jgi:hypothetical protein
MLDRRHCYVPVLLCQTFNLLSIGVGFVITILTMLECFRNIHTVPLSTSLLSSMCDPKFKALQHLPLTICLFLVMLMLWCTQFVADHPNPEVELALHAEKAITGGANFAITCAWILVGLLNTGGWFSPVSLLALMFPSVFIWSLECCTE